MTTPPVHKTGHEQAARMAEMRAQGASYRHIRATLDVSYRDIEKALGEGAKLRDDGFSHVDIGLLVGMPPGSVARLWDRPEPGHGHAFTPTVRQLHVLGALVQQRAMQFDVLAEFLGTRTNHVYELTARLTTAGMVHPPMPIGPGPKWIVPTPEAGAKVFGYRPKPWTPSRLWSIRGRAATLARIALNATEFDAWESERQLRTGSSYRGAYPYEGRRIACDSPSLAVKIVATANSTRVALVRSLTTAAVQAHRDRCAALLIVCAGRDSDATAATVRTITRDILSHGPDLHISTTTLTALTRDHRSHTDRGNHR